MQNSLGKSVICGGRRKGCFSLRNSALLYILDHFGYFYLVFLKVLLRRFSSTPFEIKVGAKIAQLIVTNIQYCDPILATELVATTRGESGFGSTGK